MDLPSTPSFRLDGRRALVTGASRGIGLGAAMALAEAGAHVVMSARSGDQLSDIADAAIERGLSVEPLQLDITDIDAVASAARDNGPFDVLCNSAGLALHGPSIDADPADFDAVIGLNVRAAFFVAREVARGMMGRGGSIIQISSQMGHVGGIDRGVYCATKHAVEGMTKSMAIEWGPENIRVNTVCPTFIRTPLTESTFANPERRAWIEEKIKLPRIGLVEDVMGAVVYLASDASAMVTGSALMIDGGWTAD